PRCRRDGQLRAEVVPGRIRRRAAADRRAERASQVGRKAVPRLAAGEGELQRHIGEHDVGIERTGATRQGVLGRVHDEPRRLRVGDPEGGAQRVPEGHLVAQPAGRPIRDPDPGAPPRATQIPNRDHDWPGVDFLGEGLRRAFALLLGGDAEVSGVVLLTLKVAVTATLIACAFGLPLGFFLATRPFWGRRAAFTLVNTALAFPTVVTGLLLFGLLSRRGPLGGVGWLYTWQAIALGDVCIALPIAAALSAAAVQGVDPRIRRTAQTLGASAWRTAWAVARDA